MNLDHTPAQRIDALHDEADFLAAQAKYAEPAEAAKLTALATDLVRKAAKIRAEEAGL